jgi:hypothetical protein
MTRPGIPAIDRVLSKCVETKAGCWEWTGTMSHDYGVVRVEGRSVPTHRLTYEFFIGEIPDGLVTDHLCNNPPCVNPWHLDPVTRRVNTQRAWARRGPDYVIGWLESFDDPFAILDALRAYLENPPAKQLWGDQVPVAPQ